MSKDVETVTIHDIISRLMNSPLNGAKPPASHRRMTEAKKMFFDRVLEEMIVEISEGKRVRIKNIGIFSLRLTQEKARNPANNISVVVENRKRLKFEPSTRTLPILNRNEVE
jgi:nucleoid DNA-binding protein